MLYEYTENNSSVIDTLENWLKIVTAEQMFEMFHAKQMRRIRK